MNKVNILIFPSGSVNAIDIYDSLKYNLHFNVFGASGKSDHTEYVYPKENFHIGDLYITNDNFFEEFNKILEKFKIDYVFPTHDTVALFLMENKEKIKSTVICSPVETTRIARSKRKIYYQLKNTDIIPNIYDTIEDVDEFPVFLKPDIGEGGKRTCTVDNKESLKSIIIENEDMIISELLPGDEYTVDCFTNSKRELLFVGPRTRERITMGLAFRSETVPLTKEFQRIADILNKTFIFRKSWYFQVKRDKKGELKLTEFSVRQAGTMALYRELGINFAALSVFDFMGIDVKILFNNYNLVLDRRLRNCFKLNYDYDKIYIDLDDTLIVKERVNTDLLKLIYQSIEKNKKIILLTKHENVLETTLKKYRINKDLFDEIILIDKDKNKSDYIDSAKAIFIDNYFPERLDVKERFNIPVFDVDAVECLIDSSML